MDSRHKADVRDLDKCREKLAEVRRRHEADALELDKCRREKEEETADAFKAWGLVDQLADALKSALRRLESDEGYGAVVVRNQGMAALVAAGRIEE